MATPKKKTKTAEPASSTAALEGVEAIAASIEQASGPEAAAAFRAFVTATGVPTGTGAAPGKPNDSNGHKYAARQFARRDDDGEE